MSHKASASSGISLDEQAAQGVAYARTIIPQDKLSTESFASDIPGVFADKAVSGWNNPFLLRGAGHRINELAKPGDHIVCYSIDRLARNVRDFANTTFHFIERGIHIHYITECINTATANGKLQANIRAAVAQWHSDMTSERTREALLIKKLGLGNHKSSEKPKWEGSKFDFSKAHKAKEARTYGTTYRYERASDISQYTSGLGLEQQARANEAYAKEWCKKTGSKDGGVFKEEAVSAFSVPLHKRPMGKKLLETVQPGDDIVVYRPDRAWRSTKDALECLDGLTAKGVYVHIVTDGIRTDTDGGLDWLAILSAVAQMESSLKRKRRLEVNEWLRRHGRCTGGVHRGWVKKTVNGKKRLKLSLNKCARIVAIYILRHEIGLSLGKIAQVEQAWRCVDKDERMTLKKPIVHRDIEKLIKSAEFIMSTVRQATWDKIMERAWKKVSTPINERHWNKWITRWNYNERLGLNCSTSDET